jgi:hypothetical protein
MATKSKRTIGRKSTSKSTKGGAKRGVRGSAAPARKGAGAPSSRGVQRVKDTATLKRGEPVPNESAFRTPARAPRDVDALSARGQ